MPDAILPTDSYDDLVEALTDAFETRYATGHDGRRRLVGILFARPESSFAKSDINQHLDYFHHRSGNHFDMFCAGYHIEPVAPDEPGSWRFTSHSFDQIRRRLEAETTWRYGGGVELLLTNAVRHGRGPAELEFASSIACDLEELKAKQAILSVEKFFEDVCRFAEESSDEDPAWGLSDRLGMKSAGSALKRLALALLPKGIGGDIERAMHFAIKDIGKRSVRAS
jgi:hypothetical protein